MDGVGGHAYLAQKVSQLFFSAHFSLVVLRDWGGSCTGTEKVVHVTGEWHPVPAVSAVVVVL